MLSNTKCLWHRFMGETFQKKSAEIRAFFTSLPSQEARYSALIEMGRKLVPIPSDFKTDDRLVPGCQSRLHLISRVDGGLVYFQAASDALISAGLAALLISVYSGETPETILKEPPRFLDDLGIYASLSMNRSNGLANIFLRMKQDALKFLLVQAQS